MSVYVGKDIAIIVQVPMEEDVSSQANGTNTVFTVSKKPISDRDQDGIADETAHVTVYVNGSPVTVSAVDDDQGQVTLASAPTQGSRVIIEYRYDSNPEIAQEITIEPKQVIEGIDGLGSNKIQAWATLLKEFGGSLREVFRTTEQFNRLTKKKIDSKYSQQFWVSGALNDFQGDTGNFSVDTQQLLVANNLSSLIGVKNSVVPIFCDGIIRSKIKHVTGDAGWIFRWDGSYSNYYRVLFDGQRALWIVRIKGGNTTTLLQTSNGIIPSDTWKDIEIVFKGNKIVINAAGSIFSVIDSDPLLIQGMPGFYAYFGLNDRFDDFQVWSEISRDEYGLILTYSRGGSTVKIGLDGVVFSEGSISSPKNTPVFITSQFRARKIKFIT